jgi:hypothetical protein
MLQHRDKEANTTFMYQNIGGDPKDFAAWSPSNFQQETFFYSLTILGLRINHLSDEA